MKLENRLNKAEKLTPIEYKIKEYILANKEDIIDKSIQEISKELFISKSALHRFCHKIGLKGLNELKLEIMKDEKNKPDYEIDVNYPFEKDASCKEIAEKLLQLYEITIKDTFNTLEEKDLMEIAKLLCKAKKIDIYTHSHNLNAAENFQDKMMTIGKNVQCHESFYKQRMQVLASTSENVALIISYSGKAQFILPIVEKLYELNVPVVLIGKEGVNPYPQYIKYTLGICGKENMRDRISQFSSHIAVQYAMDVLYGCIYNLEREKNIQSLYKQIEYMDDRKL